MFDRFRKAAAGVKHSDRLQAGLLAEDAVVVDVPPEFLRPALAGLASGDHGPAAALLADTRARAAWDERSDAAATLAQRSLRSPQWLDEWQAQEPDNPDGLLVRAQLMVMQAWELRSGARARDVSDEQWQGFLTLLADATPVIVGAVEGSPGDPAPWATAIQHGTGAGAPREVFDDYRASSIEADPLHFGTHWAALTYLTARWHGSHDESFAYAAWAADQAPADSPLQTLPLVAELEHAVDVGASEARRGRASEIESAIARADEWLRRAGDADLRVPQTRNLLALMLHLTERHAEAYEQLVAIGAHATSFPWMYYGEPREAFLKIRRGIVAKLAAQQG